MEPAHTSLLQFSRHTVESRMANTWSPEIPGKSSGSLLTSDQNDLEGRTGLQLVFDILRMYNS